MESRNQSAVSTRAPTRAAMTVLTYMSLLCTLLASDEVCSDPPPAPAEAEPASPNAASNESDDLDEPAGRWRRWGASPNTNEQAHLDRLIALGYLDGSMPPPSASGVVTHEPGRAQRGYNLYVSGHAPVAVLMDMEGRELHSWQIQFAKLWPNFRPPAGFHNHEFLRRAHLLEHGELLAIIEGFGLIKLDRDSRVLWVARNNAHHDVFVDEQKRIHVLTRRARIDPRYNSKRKILEDFVTTLDAQGKELRSVSVLQSIAESEYAPLLSRSTRRIGDVLHTNTVEVLDGRHAATSPIFKAGNVLFSTLYLDFIGILDPAEGRVVWGATGSWKRQHQPSLLKNGRILLFDNQGLDGRSRVLELDPFSLETLWTYADGPNTPLFSYDSGSVERLANGNTLIIESNAGRAFEVTPEGTRVWEFVNPHRAGDSNEFIATLFDLVRLPDNLSLDWIYEF